MIRYYFTLIIFLNLFPSDQVSIDGIRSERIVINKNPLEEEVDYEWTVVGAGVAGIIAVAILLDLGIPEDMIYWVDPLFNVGRIGEYYQNVTGNTPNSFWVDCLKASPTIEKITKEDIVKISSLKPQEYSTLSVIAEPMQKVTDELRKIIANKEGLMESLEFFDSVWHLKAGNVIKSSRNVILATGCRPVVYNYSKIADVIPLDYALDPEVLKKMVKPHDTIAVFGGAHSAILILKYLSEFNVKDIYNFYKHDILYAIDLFSPGLKGQTALWAKNILENNPPANLMRVKNTEKNRTKYLPYCNKIIYAVGYEKNPLPIMTNNQEGVDDYFFDPETGIIGTRIFGIGIAFPGVQVDNAGKIEQRIGLNSFINYALEVMPHWIKSKRVQLQEKDLRLLNMYSIFEQYLSISLL